MKPLGDLVEEIAVENAKPLPDHTPPHMRATENGDQVAAAVMTLAKELPVFVKDTKGQAGGGTYKYFTLDQIMHKLRPVLLAEGFVLSHTTEYDGPGCYSFVTQIWLGGVVVREARCPFTPHPDPQKLGSQVTYYRRYTTCMLFAIVADKDDDGAAAMEPAELEAEMESAIEELTLVHTVSGLSNVRQMDLRREVAAFAEERGVSGPLVGALIKEVSGGKTKLAELTSAHVSTLLLQIEDRGKGS